MQLRKIIVYITLLFIFTSGTLPCRAQAKEIIILINGSRLDTEAPPVITAERTLVPVRSVAEAFNFDVRWDERTKTVLLLKPGKTIEIKISSSIAKINNIETKLDVPAAILSERTYVPLRFIGEALGMEVGWNEPAQTVSINQAPSNPVTLTPIIAPPSATVAQAQEWAKKKRATEAFISLAPLYWEISKDSGVDPAVAYAQAAKETGYGKFGGVVDESFHNPCGLKISSNGSDKDPNAHMRFPDWRTGITAHIDHLALYAGAKGYPKKVTPDPKHFSFIFGRSPSVEELGGKWAPSAEYGKSILTNFLSSMKAIR